MRVYVTMTVLSDFQKIGSIHMADARFRCHDSSGGSLSCSNNTIVLSILFSIIPIKPLYIPHIIWWFPFILGEPQTSDLGIEVSLARDAITSLIAPEGGHLLSRRTWGGVTCNPDGLEIWV